METNSIEIRRLRENEERFRALYECSSDAMMTIEPPDWKFTSGNPATIKMFKVKDEKEFASLGPSDLSPKYQPDGQLSADKAKKMIMKAAKEGNNFFEWTHKRYKGDDFPATVLLTKMKINGKEAIQATVRDVTEEKRKEKELIKREKLLKQRAKETERMNSLMIGRELRMAQLKKKIKELEARLREEGK